MELAHIRHGQVADRGPAEVALPGTNYIIKAASAQKLESRGFSVAYLWDVLVVLPCTMAWSLKGCPTWMNRIGMDLFHSSSRCCGCVAFWWSGRRRKKKWPG